MARSIVFGTTLSLTFALALPVSAGAQAIPRPEAGSSSSSSSGSSSSSSSGAGGGGGGGATSSGGAESRGGATGVSISSISSPRSSGRTDPAGGSRAAATAEGGRLAPTPGGIAQRSSGGGDTSAVIFPDAGAKFAGTGTGRTSSGSQVAGYAAARTFDLTPVSFPFYGPWGQYYPLFGSGFGYGYGYAYYDPWRYGGTRWLWSRYGMWYDPWGYDPYGYTTYSSSGYSSSVHDSEPKRTGSIRLKANQNKAKVYIDGALVGVVDDFDGLSDHLELEGGPHQLEVRADGYETYVGVLVVEVGKTFTERVNLKRVKK